MASSCPSGRSRDRPHRAPVALALAASLAGCAPDWAPEQAGRGLLVIAVDALRADHVSCLGYDRPTTPALDELAAEGVLFGETFSSAPWVLPAHASILSGTDPNVSRRLPFSMQANVEYRWYLPERGPHLAVDLRAAGWATAAFMDHEWTGEGYGFQPGFQHFREAGARSDRDPSVGKVSGPGHDLLKWLGGLRSDEPWFAYLHLHDLERVWTEPDPRWDREFPPRPELDFVPPVSDFEQVFFAVPRSRWIGEPLTLGEYESRYDGALRALDEHLGRLFELLRVDGRWEDTTVVVIGTFGLQFGEAGMVLDHGRLSVADLRVPWIVRPRTGLAFEPGTRVPFVASVMDVMPTLLDLEGVPSRRAQLWQGVSQRRPLEGGTEPARHWAFASCGLQQGYAVFGERLAYEEVYPAYVGSEDLRSSWFGDDDLHKEEARFALYDRVEDSFPRLDARAERRPPLPAELSAEIADYAADVERARAAVALRTWSPDGPDAPLGAPEE